MDTDTFNLNSRDTARITRTVSAKENHVLVVKPREKMDGIMKFLRLSAGVALVAWLLWKGAEINGGWPVQLLLWGMAVILFSSPWLHSSLACRGVAFNFATLSHMCPKVWGNIAIVYSKSVYFAEFSLAGYHTARSLAQFFFYPNIGVSRLLLIRKS